jgi:tripartite-type tricarboxylate transporter receptor subunit TctC
MAKMKLHNIPYRGSSPALQGLIAVDIDLMFDNLGVSLPLIMSGKLKLLAVASPRRRRCPTCRRSLKRCRVLKPLRGTASWRPQKNPKDIVEKINADVNEALRQPGLQDRLKNLSAEVFGGSVEHTSKYLHEKVDRWGNVVKSCEYRDAVKS